MKWQRTYVSFACRGCGEKYKCWEMATCGLEKLCPTCLDSGDFPYRSETDEVGTNEARRLAGMAHGNRGLADHGGLGDGDSNI